jgi:predicted N-acetyltransferase YhbS
MMNIRQAEKADLDAIVALSMDAFREARLYRYIAPDVGERDVFMRGFFGRRFYGGFGTNVMEVAEEGGRIVGAAIWVPPGPDHSGPPPSDAEKAEAEKKMMANFQNFRGILAEAGVPDPVLARWMELVQTLGASEAKNTQKPHWALAPVFVHPDFQGKSIGSTLMRKQFAVIDQDKTPITLTAQELDNVELYKHYGFVLTSETRIGNSDVISYGMQRD